MTNIGNNRTPILEADIQFTAYSVTTTTSVAGHCITHSSSPVPLLDGHIVPIPNIQGFVADFPVPLQNATGSLADSQFSSYTDAKYSSFLGDAYSSFYEEIGYEGCAATLPPSQVYPTYNGEAVHTAVAGFSAATPAESSPTAILSTSPPEISGSVQRAHSARTIIVSVVVPTTALVIILLCLVVIRIYRKKRKQAASTKLLDITSDVQPYMDQKAELEDEERRRHELDADGRTYEMEGVDSIFEMPGNGDAGTMSARSDRIQELRGAEHSKELEVPSNI